MTGVYLFNAQRNSRAGQTRDSSRMMTTRETPAFHLGIMAPIGLRWLSVSADRLVFHFNGFSTQRNVTEKSVTVGKRKVRVVELFCGAGGLSLGLQRVGFEIVQAYDSWKPAVEIYRHNVGPHAWQADLKDIFRVGPMVAALAPDMICGGPPCQDFSMGGDRVEGERAAMTRAFAMLVCIARPAWFLMENVGPAAKSQAWADARAMLVRAGYGLTETKLDASFYGVPQARKRLFVIGRLGEQDGFLVSALVAARSQRQTVIGDVLDVPEGYVYSRPFRAGRGVRSLAEPFPTITRTSWEPPRARYLNNPNPNDAIPADQAHVMTLDQLALIQGFPRDWRWVAGSRQDIRQMIANAVPSPLAEAIGRVILARENGESIPEIRGRFGLWLRQRGFSQASVRNAKTRLNRARRLLRGKTFANAALEIAALEAVAGFAALPIATRSDLRKALRLYREWQTEPKKMRSRSSGSGNVAKVLAAGTVGRCVNLGAVQHVRRPRVAPSFFWCSGRARPSS